MCRALKCKKEALSAFWALPVEEKRRRAALVVASYPRKATEQQILSLPRTWLLAALLEADLPGGNMIVSPSQILAWLGLAASNRSNTPAGYVWGVLRNMAYSKGLTENREGEWSDAFVQQPVTPQIEETLARAQAWERLPPEDQETLELDLEYPVDALARLWEVSRDGAEKRIYRARKRLKELYELF